MQPVLQDLATAYESAHPHVTVLVSGGGSEGGRQALEAGTADLAASSWEGQSELEEGDRRIVSIARDGLSVIVNAANPVEGLTILQLRALYRGEILDWRALGGQDAEPIIVSREDGSGDRAAFEGMVMGGERVTLNAVVLPTAQTVAEYVARHPNAVGYVSMAQRNDATRVVAIEGALPSPDEVRSGAYHLSRLLSLHLPQRATPSTQNFVNFVLSPAGQAVVARYHVSLR